ncbi:MAG: SUMF1/EgtB/PvdO family nonheme iron enzyme, partial [Pyrinomonadaceae bacterium]|nr:SUMF1/EgtB/PvdO family nonheme iron enzyme [Pyrinomonadaceae bacterium]
GGTFNMGRNDGKDNEKPEHQVTVTDFWMDKTEVTNAEYGNFINATDYKPPTHFVRREPASGEESLPVTRVSFKDAKAFAEWRSKRDGLSYRLPTEKEWEYAARNGEKDNLYPWGANWQDGYAVFGQRKSEQVGSKPNGKNSWGVFDLIGNVWEWTSSEANLYPGSSGEKKETKEPHYMLRGGGFTSEPTGKEAITSASRIALPENTEDDRVGFRLVRSN